MAKVYMRSYLLIRVLLLKGHLVVKGVTSGGLLGLKLRFRVETQALVLLGCVTLASFSSEELCLSFLRCRMVLIIKILSS